MKELNELVYRVKGYFRTKSEGQPEQINVSCETILAIAEAFRALEQRAEAAEAKVDELNSGILSLIPDCRYMDPPDGGDVTPLEQLSRMVAELRPAPAADLVPGEWTNEQCLEFLSIAFRHAEISGDIEMDDIRLAVKMVNEGAKNHQ